jgi:hypothetical protein
VEPDVGNFSKCTYVGTYVASVGSSYQWDLT